MLQLPDILLELTFAFLTASDLFPLTITSRSVTREARHAIIRTFQFQGHQINLQISRQEWYLVKKVVWDWNVQLSPESLPRNVEKLVVGPQYCQELGPGSFPPRLRFLAIHDQMYHALLLDPKIQKV